MGFTKLDEGIIFSSIMGEDDSVFRVWIVLLATCKGNGISPVSEVFLSSITKKDITEIDRCIKILSSPDGHSRTKNEDGRRIERIDGGFRIINYREYRDFSYADNTVAERQRRFRAKKELYVTGVTERNGRNGMSRKSNGDISASASASASSESSLIPVNELRTPIPPKTGVPSLFPEIHDEEEEEEKEKEEKDGGLFGMFWEMYPRKVGKGAARKSWKKIKEPGLTLDKIETALAWQKKSEQWIKGHGEFIPLPATYLNQDRWMDEPQKAPVPAATRAQPMFATETR